MSRRAPRHRSTPAFGRILATLFATLAVLASVLVPVQTATATLEGWKAGNIISDEVFLNSSTMTEAQIQEFFNSKVSRCQGGSDQWGPIICLKDYKTDSVNMPADKYCKGYTGARGESAARIIHRVSQSCGINPQVLIVMLQKEQGLVTHTWPSAWRYDAALGQGCPDTAPCDPSFVGFFHQIYGAAKQMQIYMEGIYFTWYAPGKTWNILYNPNHACGSSPVYIENKATSALYYYTPYQPNAAALAAGYGTGDGCSAYGNRNFYNYFTDWFGSTRAVSTPPPPRLGTINDSDFVTAIDAGGVLWGYPFNGAVWGTRVALATGVGGVSSVLGVGDLNLDGHRDLILWGASGVSFMAGGASGFSNARAIDLDWSSVVLATAAGDMDGDGIGDVITTQSDGRLLLWRGDGSGGLHTGVPVGIGWTGMNAIIGALDLDADGGNDLVARDVTGGLWVYYGDGSGGWKSTRQIGQGWQSMTAILSPGDFNGDGVDDLLARTPTGSLVLYPGDGIGAVYGGTVHGNGWHAMTTVSGGGRIVPPGETAPEVVQPGVGDVDGVAGNDVLALTLSGELRVYGGDGAGGWTGFTTVAHWSGEDTVLPLGDFDGDGHRDIGRITTAGAFEFAPGLPGGGFGSTRQIGQGWERFTTLVGALDFDGDHHMDVLAVDEQGRLLLYRGNGDGGWSSGSGELVGTAWHSFTAIFNAGDFDGDGKADLLARAVDGRLLLYPTLGNGGWGSAQTVGHGWSGIRALTGPGDFDGDRRVDVLAVTGNGDMLLYRGDGSGGWRGGGSKIGHGWTIMTQIR